MHWAWRAAELARRRATCGPAQDCRLPRARRRRRGQRDRAPDKWALILEKLTGRALEPGVLSGRHPPEPDSQVVNGQGELTRVFRNWNL